MPLWIPGELVTLAKSWIQPAKMKITSDAYTGGIYDQSERAYIIEKTNPGHSTPCTFTLKASKDSPLLNPAVIIKNWGSRPSTLSIDGKTIKPGKDFRQGIHKGPLTEDLVIWIRLEAQKPVKLVLSKI